MSVLIGLSSLFNSSSTFTKVEFALFNHRKSAIRQGKHYSSEIVVLKNKTIQTQYEMHMCHLTQRGQIFYRYYHTHATN